MNRVLTPGRPAAFALAIALALLVSCRQPSAYKPTVGKFRDSASVVIESTKSYLVALNKTERDRYIQRQSADSLQIRLVEIEEVQAFTPDAIGARLRALDQLADYSDLLYQLATSDAPETAKARATDLGKALDSLSGEVAKLSGAKNAGFKAAVDKAFPIIGDVLKAIVDRRIEEALKQAIVAGETPVTTLIQAIKVDAELAYQLKRNALSAHRAAAVNEYNREFEKGPQADRAKLKTYADLISQTEDRWELFQTARPVDGLDAMQRAAAAMVKFAKTPKPNITDFASFVEAMEAFSSTAKRVGEAVKQLSSN
jgi:hypothetical protein